MAKSLRSVFRKNDELYTPAILVEPIVEYIPKGSVIWCPFDTKNSEFVRVLTRKGFKVLYSHIWDGRDFFEYEPEDHYDVIISNPPFSQKLKVFERLYALGKPFAVLMNLEILNYQAVGRFFLENRKQLQLLIPDKKVSFNGNTAAFNTSYFCWKMLPRDLMFSHLEHNNSGKYFVGSKMYDFDPDFISGVEKI